MNKFFELPKPYDMGIPQSMRKHILSWISGNCLAKRMGTVKPGELMRRHMDLYISMVGAVEIILTSFQTRSF